ncbi:hypothetical protein HY772_00375 [Candidatus Woesearchaeota archaeon]|nr:hypothetical protein [Candidatus Woesearchaeota archaeon]
MHKISTQDKARAEASPARDAAFEGILSVPVVSNVGAARTVHLCELLSTINCNFNIIHPEKRLVLIDRNEEYLSAFIHKMLIHIMPSYEAHETTHQMPHYKVSEKGFMKTYVNNTQDIVAKMIARVKHPDSIFEKITRKQACYGTLENTNSSLAIDDVFGLTCLARQHEHVDRLCARLKSFDFLCIDKVEDRYHCPPDNGYTALHYNTRWKNGNPALENINVEIQVTDLDNYDYNVHGREDQPHRSHRFYAQDKLSKRHDLGQYQVVIVDSSVRIPAEYLLGKHEGSESLEVARIDTIFGKYILISTLCATRK